MFLKTLPNPNDVLSSDNKNAHLKVMSNVKVDHHPFTIHSEDNVRKLAGLQMHGIFEEDIF